MGVFGAVIEMRLDALGKVISYQARWRPPTGRRISRPLRPFVPPEPDADHKEDHHGKQGLPALVYYQEGDAIPQAHLCPYHQWTLSQVFASLNRVVPWFNPTVATSRIRGFSIAPNAMLEKPCEMLDMS